jgi:hypothetical protein
MYWRCGSSGTVPALQVQSPDFKTPVPPKKKRKEKKCLNGVGLTRGLQVYMVSAKQVATFLGSFPISSHIKSSIHF